MPIMDRLPTGASPGSLHEICRLVRESPRGKEVLKDRSELNPRILHSNIKYGVLLGFLNEDDEQVNATSRGITFGYYDGLSEETEPLFAEGVQNSDNYLKLVRVLKEEESENITDQGFIDRGIILRHLRITFDMDLSDRMLMSATSTFFQTLEAAGCGKYVLGRGGKPTRLVINEPPRQFNRLLNSSKRESTAGVEEEVDKLEISEIGLDESLIQRCLPKLEQGHYQSAIQSAFISLEEKVREEGGFSAEKHGVDLMVDAFNPDNSGPLSFGMTNSEKEGTMLLYKGAIQAIRNPASHHSLENLDKRQAYDIVCLINLLITFINEPDYYDD